MNTTQYIYWISPKWLKQFYTVSSCETATSTCQLIRHNLTSGSRPCLKRVQTCLGFPKIHKAVVSTIYCTLIQWIVGILNTRKHKYVAASRYLSQKSPFQISLSCCRVGYHIGNMFFFHLISSSCTWCHPDYLNYWSIW